MIDLKTAIAKAGRKFRELTGTLRPSDVVDLRRLYRIKGHKDLFVQASGMQSNIVSMANWNNGARVNVHQGQVYCIGMYEVAFLSGKRENLSVIFDRLHKIFGDATLTEEDCTMEDAAPGHNERQFKPYHLRKILGWYNQVIVKMNKKKAA